MKLKYGTIDVVDNEQQLISCFLKQFKQFDADLIIAHQMAGNQLDLLIDKCRKYRIQEVYNLGRLSKSTPVYVCRAWSWLRILATLFFFSIFITTLVLWSFGVWYIRYFSWIASWEFLWSLIVGHLSTTRETYRFFNRTSMFILRILMIRWWVCSEQPKVSFNSFNVTFWMLCLSTNSCFISKSFL